MILPELDELNEKVDSSIFEQFQSILNNLNSLKSNIILINQQIKSLEKDVNKKIKLLNKEVTKSNTKKANKKKILSGFAKPSKVTKELCEFMNKTEGTEIARTEVTRALVNYIKENHLENTNNKKIISPDDKLKYLLGVNNEELTYFNIQKYMNKHFISTNEII